MKVILNKNTLFCIILYTSLIFSVIFFPSSFTLPFSLIFMVIVTYLNYVSILQKNSSANSFFVTLPLIFSSFQNIYLGVGVDNLNELTLQVLLTIGIAIISLVVFCGIVFSKIILKNYIWLIFSIIIILLQSVLLLVLFPSNLSAYLSSLRNILSPMLIFYYAVLSFKNIELNRFYRNIFILITFVLIFGFFEYLVGNIVWTSLNIKQLWALKGLPIWDRVVPGNFYSSELINGNQLRRMVSTFADPVNLGSFLFSVFMVAWYRKKFFLQILILLCFILSVSKGALLSFLIFIVVYSWIRDKTKLIAIWGLLIAMLSGILFYQFSQVSSFGSVNAHINGFLNSLLVPMKYPLGMGVGNAGVLASKLGSQVALSSEVLETGVGMIIAQLGFIGTFIYLVFFIKLSHIGKSIGNKEDRILWFTLLYGFFANALFNEVALSPNSCTLYFLMLGMLYNKNELEK